MKKYILSVILGLTFVIGYAQLPYGLTKIKTYSVEQGKYVTFNPSLTDTLKSGDTLVYVINITHTNAVEPYINQYWKLVAADTTVTVTFWQSTDVLTTVGTAKNRTWFQVQAGASPSNYTKTVTATSANYVDYSFWKDSVYFDGRALAIRYIAKTKTGFKSIPYGTIKVNIK